MITQSLAKHCKTENTPVEDGLHLKACQRWTEVQGRVTKVMMHYCYGKQDFGDLLWRRLDRKNPRICDHIIILPNSGKSVPPVGGWKWARERPFHYNNVMQTSK